ncbi:hypothetical protein PLICRDRAFT_105127 [Plicaturopsis crispa FD-325 SS-3]|nr:hypothetical protein PLICRDRAFT_105127 [Plicaturopsis crispa FD-325 SS-3]
MKYPFTSFLADSFRKWPEVVQADLTGKTVMLIGANTGIGLEATIHFAKMKPARIIMACRSLEKGEAAIAKVQAATGYKNAEVRLVDLDKSSSVVQFVTAFEEDGGRLDIVVANAALATQKYGVSSDGWENMLQVNLLSIALLSLLLLPILERTAKDHSTTPRLTVVASGAHYWTRVPDDVLRSPKILEKLSEKDYCSTSAFGDRYALTKLLDVFFVRALNERLGASSAVVVDAVDPGFVYSELRREFSTSIFNTLMEWLLAHSAEEGSRQLVYGAIGGEDAAMRGAYIALSKIQEVSDFALSPEGIESQNRVWDETIEILSKTTPKLGSIVSEYLSGSSR